MSETDQGNVYTLLEDLGLWVDDLAPADRDFLKALSDLGEATTSELRKETVLDRQKIHHRFNKFEEKGLIDVDRVGTENHDGRKTNVARLTDDGERLVESGILDDVEGVNLTVEKIVSHFDYLQEHYKNRFDYAARERDSLERRVSNLREDLDALSDAYEHYRRTKEQEIQRRDERIETLEGAVTSLEERIEGLETDT